MDMTELNLSQTLKNSLNVHNSTAQYTEAELVDSWLLTSSPLAVAALVVGYLSFVQYLGPRLMERRKPYNLKAVMMAYNLVQVVYNASIPIKHLSIDAIHYLIYNHCYPLSQTSPLRIQLCNSMWHYTFLKMLDLLDTVFFVLRKKQRHVSFLHVYHHSSMLILSFCALKYIRAEVFVMVGIINTTVHVVMYSYYFLAALGEQVRPYLWWKRYVTTLQIAQFVILVAYYILLSISNCTHSKIISYISASQAFVFLCLFIKFYMQSYSTNKQDPIIKIKNL